QSSVLDDAKVRERLRAMRAGVLLIGVTASGSAQSETIHRALELRCDPQPLFSAVQATWNLLERNAESALREAHQAGITVLIKEPLANGLLTSSGELGRSGQLRNAADRLRVSPDVIAGVRPSAALGGRRPARRQHRGTAGVKSSRARTAFERRPGSAAGLDARAVRTVLVAPRWPCLDVAPGATAPDTIQHARASRGGSARNHDTGPRRGAEDHPAGRSVAVRVRF